MNNRFQFLSGLLFLLLALPAAAQSPEITLRTGLVITQSCRIKPGEYRLSAPSPDSARQGPVLIIRGDHLSIDFQGAELRSGLDPTRPDRFAGVAIQLEGRHITLKNARIHGYKVALLAVGTTGLRIENSDFSYNYRPRLRSVREHEDFSDWLSYHHNDQDEWLRYGAGLYLKNCDSALVKDCRITGCQNALLLSGCRDALVYNNIFQFNSGLGIGLYRSSHNRVMHNRLDWNVRGYSHGIYQRGQDSAALLCYEQSNDNLFAFNSCTHSGDGFFLWAGQHTMDTGEGGCNDNVVFGNDFSHAPTNGVEATFSRNRIQGNLIRECTYGIWGGYSYESVLMGNYIADCKTAIAIEHGQNNTIRQNYLDGNGTGIQLWARKTQPSDWGYVQKRDTRSRDVLIDRNVFLRQQQPLKVSASQNITINGENLFSGFQTFLDNAEPNTNLKFLRNELYGSAAQLERLWAHPELTASRQLNFSHPDQQPKNPYAPLEIPYTELAEPDSLPDGMLAALPPEQWRGRQYIFIDEWGPFDFQRPAALLADVNPLRSGEGMQYVLKILGPPGHWKITGRQGVANIDQVEGPLPAFLSVTSQPGAEDIRVQVEYTGEQAIRDVFGRPVPAGAPYHFEFNRFEKKLDWNLRFFNYTPAADSLLPTLEALEKNSPVIAEQKASELYFAWWESPAPGLVDAEHFATLATSTFSIAPGRYRFELTSDDGARLYLDGRRLIDHWDVHEAATDEVEVTLGGQHTLRIEHLEAGGFATLGFRMTPLR
ncbi:MAG: right-handed parallel beta-helix repeat-containing protein [Saprospiraceae bacterium]|nr:right-handed parallel beta-helix repeat-containing protein [Saprospiraceae bacterium]